MRSGKVENGLQSQDDTGLGQKPQTQSTTLNVNAELHNTQVDMSHIASTLIAKMPNPRPATPPALINWRSVHSFASPATALSFLVSSQHTSLPKHAALCLQHTGDAARGLYQLHAQPGLRLKHAPHVGALHICTSSFCSCGTRAQPNREHQHPELTGARRSHVCPRTHK